REEEGAVLLRCPPSTERTLARRRILDERSWYDYRGVSRCRVALCCWTSSRPSSVHPCRACLRLFHLDCAAAIVPLAGCIQWRSGFARPAWLPVRELVPYRAKKAQSVSTS